MILEILIATKNVGKADEFKRIFGKKGITVKTLLDLKDVPGIIEDGKTFEENALKKAQTLTDKLNMAVLADDSGLSVDYLNGQPGVFSARYASDHDDAANRKKVLEKLAGVDEKNRTAHFNCALVVTAPNKKPLVKMGVVDGIITTSEKGENGFGYDSIFYYPEFKRTFAELTQDEKNKVSHRGRAIEKLMESFDEWMEN